MEETPDNLEDLANWAADCISSSVLNSPKAIAAALAPYLRRAYTRGLQDGYDTGVAWSRDQVNSYFDSQGETAR